MPGNLSPDRSRQSGRVIFSSRSGTRYNLVIVDRKQADWGGGSGHHQPHMALRCSCTVTVTWTRGPGMTLSVEINTCPGTAVDETVTGEQGP